MSSVPNAVASDGSGNLDVSISKSGRAWTLETLYEYSGSTNSRFNYFAVFPESRSPLLSALSSFTGEEVARITVKLSPTAPNGTRIDLLINPDSTLTQLMNQLGTASEAYDEQRLELVNGCIELTSSTLIGSPLPVVSPTPPSSLRVDPRVEQVVGAKGEADVMIAFEPTKFQGAGNVERIRSGISMILNRFAAGEFKPRVQFVAAAGFAGKISTQGLERLRSMPEILAIDFDHKIVPTTCEARYGSWFQQAGDVYGLTGAGVRVAVVDSGVAWDHTALLGTVSAAGCTNALQCTTSPPQANAPPFCQ